MRTSLLVLLLASVAAPAMAASGPETGDQNWRELMRARVSERAAARAEQRQESEAEAEPQEQARPRRRESRRAQAGPLVQPQEVLERRGAGADEDEERGLDAPPAGRLAPRQGQRADNFDSVRDWRRGERDQLRDVRVGTRPGSRPSPVIRPPRGARPDVQAPAPARVSRHRDIRPWHREWRGDRRYDWRRYRDRNRWAFNLGYYYDPFGWSYRRYPVGWRLWSSYYEHEHWLRDPWRYRLPPAFGPYRWVRYWDDALLVDIHSGRVVDVIYDFFW